MSLTKLMTPKRLEELTGLTVENQRAWERGGFWHGCFQSTNGGQRRYAIGDVLFVASTRVVAAELGLSLSVASAAVSRFLPQIAAVVRGRELSDGHDASIPLFVWPLAHSTEFGLASGLPLVGADFLCIRLSDLNRSKVYCPLGGHVLDPVGIAGSLPDAVKQLFLPDEVA